jgi:NitT/TauT family transport system substrate-binding protein
MRRWFGSIWWGIAAAGLALSFAVLLPRPQGLRGEQAGVQEKETKPVILKLQWRPQAQFAGYMVAEKKEYFKKAGLPDVRLEWYSSEGDPPLKAVLNSKVDFCSAWLSQAVSSRSHGEPLVNIAQIMQKSALMLVAHKEADSKKPGDKPIEKPQDMKGRRVGVWRGDFEVQPKAFFNNFGINLEDEKDVKKVDQSYSMAPFLLRAVDVASAMYYNEYHKLLESGLRDEEIIKFRFSDPEYGLNFPEDGIYCTEATRRDRASVCLAVVSASLDGWKYAADPRNEADVLDIVMDYCEKAHLATNRNHQRWMLARMLESIAGVDSKEKVATCDRAQWGRLKREDYQTVTKTLKDQRLTENIPRYEDFYRPALTEEDIRP